VSDKKKPQHLTHATGTPVTDNLNILTAGPRGPALLQDLWLIEKLAHFDREVIPERRMHAKGAGAHGTFTVPHDITRYTKAKVFSEIGKQTPMMARFSTVAGERGAADAERDIRGFALKFYTEEGNWDMVGNNTPVFFFRDPLRFPDLNHAIKRDPRTGRENERRTSVKYEANNILGSMPEDGLDVYEQRYGGKARKLLDELDPDVFLQIHRGTVVNVNAIAAVHRDLRGRLEVQLKQRKEILQVSASFAHLFKQM